MVATLKSVTTFTNMLDKEKIMRAINTIINYDQVEFEISYTKYLMEVFSEPSVEELDEMERDFFKSLTSENRIVTLKPLNNPFYQPYQGA
jgi:hypothetical protein